MQCPLSLPTHKYKCFLVTYGWMWYWQLGPYVDVLESKIDPKWCCHLWQKMFISSAPVTKIIQGEWDTGQLLNIVKKLHRPKETSKRKKEIDFYHDTESHFWENTNRPEFFESSVGFKVTFFNCNLIVRVFPASFYQPWKGNYRFCNSRSPAPKSSLSLLSVALSTLLDPINPSDITERFTRNQSQKACLLPY